MTLVASRLDAYPASVDESVELDIVRGADGGAGVGFHPDGRVVFVEGALPGERVAASITAEYKRHYRGVAVDVIDAAEGRLTPICPTRRAGCGGCDLAHADIETQHDLKVAVVRDSLTRIGRLDSGLVDDALETSIRAPDHGSYHYRTTVRAAISNGRAGYRRAGSHDVVAANECRVAHRLLEEVLVESRFGDEVGSEVVIRVSAHTGQRLIVVDGDANSVESASDVVVVSRRELDDGRKVAITEHAADREWQVSATSFFQPGPTVATLLAAAVAERVGDLDGKTLVDAYCGVGMFGGSVGSTASRVIAIERAGSSTADARVNLSHLPADIVESAVEAWTPQAADVVIADPARAGLGSTGVSVLEQCGAQTFVLVSCDTGSLGRDIGLLTNSGYVLESVELVDAFADTSHIEVVSTLRR